MSNSFACLRNGCRYGMAALLMLVVAMAGCGSDDAATAEAGEAEVQYEMGDPITDSTYAAIVTSQYGTDTLTTAEFRQQIANITRQFPQIQGNVEQSRELRRSIVEDFILRHAIQGEADRIGLEADTARVAAQMQQYRGQFESNDQFQQMLAANDMTEDSLEDQVEEFVRQQMMLENLSEGAEAPTEQELEDFRQEQSEQVRAQHILFLTQGVPEEEQTEVRTRAEAVLDSIKSGADFAEMARRHSEDGTASVGGDLGYFSRGQMVPPFEEAAYALADSGDVTQDLVETRYGYHIIRLTGRQTGELMDTSRARQMVTRQREREALEEGLDQLRDEVTVRVNPDVIDADLNAEA